MSGTRNRRNLQETMYLRNQSDEGKNIRVRENVGGERQETAKTLSTEEPGVGCGEKKGRGEPSSAN